MQNNWLPNKSHVELKDESVDLRDLLMLSGGAYGW